MQVNKYQKKVYNLPISQKNKNLLLYHTFKYGLNNNDTNNLNYVNQSIKQNYRSIKEINSEVTQNQSELQQEDENKYQKISKVQKNECSHLYLVQSFPKVKKSSNVEQNILNICHKNLITCSKIVKQRSLKEAEIILSLISETLSDFSTKSISYLWKIIKIKFTLVKAELILSKIDQKIQIDKKQCEFILRFPLYCKQLQKQVKYYLLLSEDYYSFIEVIYIIAIKSFSIQPTIYKKFNRQNLHQKIHVQSEYLIYKNIIKNKKNILQLIQNCRLSLSRQLQKLCGIIAEVHDKKLFLIITSKSQILLKLYGFELAVMYIEGIYQKTYKNKQQKQMKSDWIQPFSAQQHIRTQLQKIKKKIWFKYQNLFKMVPNCLDNNSIQESIFQIFVGSLNEVSGANFSKKSEKTQNQLQLNQKKMNLVLQENESQNYFYNVEKWMQDQANNSKNDKIEILMQEQQDNQQIKNDKQVSLSFEQNKIDVTTKPRVVIHDIDTYEDHSYKKLQVKKINVQKIGRPSILIKHNLIGQENKGDTSGNLNLKSQKIDDIILKYSYGSEGKNKKKVIIIQNQQQSLSTPKIDQVNHQINPKNIILQQDKKLKRKQLKIKIVGRRNNLSHDQSISQQLIKKQTKSLKINTMNQYENKDNNISLGTQSNKKTKYVVKRSEKKSVLSQSQKITTQVSVGKRIYKMEVFKMALIADPFRKKSNNIKLTYGHTQSADFIPFQRVKKCKSLNSSQKFNTIVPGLLTSIDKKRDHKKLIIGKKK